MIIRIITKSYIFSFNNVYYDEEAGLLKIIGEKSANSIVFDYIEMKDFLEEIMNEDYYVKTDVNETSVLLNLYLDNLSNLNLTQNKLSNIFIHNKNNLTINKIKNKINKKFFELNAIDFDVVHGHLLEKVYKNLYFLYNHFQSVEKLLIKEKINFTIYDYIFDNLN